MEGLAPKIWASDGKHGPAYDICNKGYSSEEKIEGITDKKKERKKRKSHAIHKKGQNKELILKENRMEWSEENKRQWN